MTVTDPTTLVARQQSLIHPFDGAIHFDQTILSGKVNWAINFTPAINEDTFRFNRIDQTHSGSTLNLTVQYHQSPSRLWSLTLADLASREVKTSYTVYVGSRPAPESYFDQRIQSAGPNIRLRLRNAF